MRFSAFHVFVLFFACRSFCATAQTDATSLDRNIVVFQEKWRGIEQAWTTKSKGRKAAYLGELAALGKSFQSEGDLEGVLACREEAARVEAGGGSPLGAGLKPPEFFPMETVKTTEPLPGGGRLLRGAGDGKSISFAYFFSEGRHRFVLVAAQQKAGREDARGLFKVGDIYQAPFSVSSLKAAPENFVFECDIPAGGHPVAIEFTNPGPEGGNDRALLITSLSVEAPAARPRVAEAPRLGALQAAWSADEVEYSRLRGQEQKDLAKKYLDALVGQKTNLVRAGHDAEAGLIQAEVDRVQQLFPAGLPVISPEPPAASAAGRIMLQYTFDAPSGKRIKPEGGQGPVLEAHGGAGFTPIPNCGGVLSMGGYADYLAAATPSGLDLDGQSFTITYLAQEVDAIYSAILYKGQQGVEASELVVGYHAGNLVFKMGVEKLMYEAKTDLEIWKQVALVFNASTREQEIYMDGRKVASRVVGSMLKGSDGQPLLVGRHPHRPEVGFNGKMDNLRIANRALAPHEISALFQRDKLDMDKMIRSWLGPPPRNPRELETFLSGSTWVLRLERAPEGASPLRYVVFRPGGRMEIPGYYENFIYKANSARNLEVSREYGGTVYKLEFSAGADRFGGDYLGDGARDYGSKRRGVFFGRDKR